MERLSKVSLVGCCVQLGADCDRSIFDEASRASVDQHSRIDQRFGGKTLRSTLDVSVFNQSHRLPGERILWADDEQVSTVKLEQALAGAKLVPAQPLAVRYVGMFFGAWGVGDGGAWKLHCREGPLV